MSSILEIIELTQRYRRASAGDQRRRRLPAPISESCRNLLDEAEALGLDFDDVLDALRHSATQPSQSN